MPRYVAVRDCVYNGELYKAGSYLEYYGKPVVCPACTDGTNDGAICRPCRATKRISPPHHFRLVELDSDGEEMLKPTHKQIKEGEKKAKLLKEAEDAESELLKAEIRRLGGSFTWNCGVERLRMQLQKLQKEVGERNVAPPPVIY